MTTTTHFFTDDLYVDFTCRTCRNTCQSVFILCDDKRRFNSLHTKQAVSHLRHQWSCHSFICNRCNNNTMIQFLRSCCYGCLQGKFFKCIFQIAIASLWISTVFTQCACRFIRTATGTDTEVLCIHDHTRQHQISIHFRQIHTVGQIWNHFRNQFTGRWCTCFNIDKNRLDTHIGASAVMIDNSDLLRFFKNTCAIGLTDGMMVSHDHKCISCQMIQCFTFTDKSDFLP